MGLKTTSCKAVNSFCILRLTQDERDGWNMLQALEYEECIKNWGRGIEKLIQRFYDNIRVKWLFKKEDVRFTWLQAFLAANIVS